MTIATCKQHFPRAARHHAQKIVSLRQCISFLFCCLACKEKGERLDKCISQYTGAILNLSKTQFNTTSCICWYSSQLVEFSKIHWETLNLQIIMRLKSTPTFLLRVCSIKPDSLVARINTGASPWKAAPVWQTNYCGPHFHSIISNATVVCKQCSPTF